MEEINEINMLISHGNILIYAFKFESDLQMRHKVTISMSIFCIHNLAVNTCNLSQFSCTENGYALISLLLFSGQIYFD